MDSTLLHVVCSITHIQESLINPDILSAFQKLNIFKLKAYKQKLQQIVNVSARSKDFLQVQATQLHCKIVLIRMLPV